MILSKLGQVVLELVVALVLKLVELQLVALVQALVQVQALVKALGVQGFHRHHRRKHSMPDVHQLRRELQKQPRTPDRSSLLHT
jgi:hypothetical protein